MSFLNKNQGSPNPAGLNEDNILRYKGNYGTLDGIHARVGLHPLDTVLSLVWGQLPGIRQIVFSLENSSEKVNIMILGMHSSGSIIHSFTRDPLFAADKLPPSISAQITCPLPHKSLAH